MSGPRPIATYDAAAPDSPPLLEFAISDARRVNSTWKNLGLATTSPTLIESEVNWRRCLRSPVPLASLLALCV